MPARGARNDLRVGAGAERAHELQVLRIDKVYDLQAGWAVREIGEGPGNGDAGGGTARLIPANPARHGRECYVDDLQTGILSSQERVIPRDCHCQGKPIGVESADSLRTGRVGNVDDSRPPGPSVTNASPPATVTLLAKPLVSYAPTR